MTLFFALLSFVSGILTLRFPLTLLFLSALILKFLRQRQKLIMIIACYLCGLFIMILLLLCAKLPFLAHFGVVVKTSKQSFIVLTFQGRFYVESRGHDYHVGDVLRLSANRMPLIFAHIEGDFDYTKYLVNEGVISALKLEYIKVVVPSFLRIFRVDFTLLVHYPSHLAPLVSVLLTKTIDYDDPFLKVIREYDLLFLITMSGAHLSLIRQINKKVINVFTSDRRSEVISHLLLLPLFILNITKFAFYRIFGIFLLRSINKKRLNNYFSNLELNVILAFIFLFLNPYLIYNAGFYLAFSLIFLFNFIHPPKGFKGRIYAMLLVLVVIIPYKIFVTGRVSLSSLYLPFIMTPLVSIWFIAYFITLPFPFLQNSAITLLNFIYRVLSVAANYPFTLYFAHASQLVVGLTLCLIFGLLLTIMTKAKRLRRKVSALLISTLALSFIPFHRLCYDRLTFINVGQGDSILLETQKATVLIDTGGLYKRDIAREVLIPFFRRRNIYKLDYLITTHDDFDHNGGVESLMANFPVHALIREKEMFPLDINGLTLYNLNPYNYGEDNLDSLIIYFSLRDFDVLLMADAGIENEADLIQNYPDLHVDILKVGHHGSNTSTSPAFIAHYLPRLAIISAGYQNKYGHPHREVLDTLNKYNVEVRRTDFEGTITLKSSII